MKPISEAILEIAKKLADTQVSPVGTIGFQILGENFFIEDDAGGKIFEAYSGAHAFLVFREAELVIHYFHWSPGTGSRVASIEYENDDQATGAQIIINWHPKKTQLFVIPLGVPGAKEHVAEGRQSSKSFRVNKAGQIVQVGDEGIVMLDVRMSVGEDPILLPTAIEIWQATIEATRVLQSGQSDVGYMFEVVQNNSVLTKLITGFETYCKARLPEIELEGVTPNLENLVKLVSFNSEERASLIEKSMSIVKELGVTPLELWVEKQRRINFQNFDDAKQAFKRSYGIKFGEIGVSSDEIAMIRILFEHRHRVIHVSPLATLMPNNNPSVGKKLLEEAPDRFKDFIAKLHEATLMLGVTEGKD